MMMAAVGAAVMVAATVGEAAACDRARSPMATRAVAVAVADVVVSGVVAKVEGDLATVTIVEAFKGGGKGTAVGDTITIRGVTAAGLGRDCGVHSIAAGGRHVFSLWSPAGAVRELRLVDAMGGVEDVGPSSAADYAAAVTTQHPHSPWSTSGDVQAQLVLNPEPSNAGDVDLVLVVRNVGARPLAWKYRTWPLASQSRCSLDVVETSSGRRVAAQPVPIAKKDIRTYFAKHGPRYDLTLAPGDSYLLLLDAVTTARPGWGYKERTGFAFYPVRAAGPHTLAATCVNLFGRGTRTTTAAIALTLTPAAAP